MTRRNDDDDFDEHGVLKDGRSVRVPMMMRDAMSPLQRAVAQHSLAMQLHDGRGGTVGHRPSFAFSTDASLNDAKEQAYRLYDEEVAAAYKQCSHSSFDANGERQSKDDEAYDASVMDERERAYAAYDAAVTNAWRGPREGKW